MMIGTLLLNFWAALVSFSIYFLIMFQKPDSPLNILMGSFIFALGGFILMFLIRYLIGYIIYTPDESVLIDEFEEIAKTQQEENHQSPQKMPSSSEANESSEEIAQVVRTMMNS